MKADILFELFLILLCMIFAYKWKQEKLMHEHFKSMYKDKCDMVETYKLLFVSKEKRATRMQNELNKVNNIYLKLQREVDRQKKKFENN